MTIFKIKYGEGNGNPFQHSCLGNPVDRGAWWAAVIGSHRVGHDWSNLACIHALEKEMATHSSVLAWRIPGTEEPGGLPSMGSQSWTRLKRLSSSSKIKYLYEEKGLFIFTKQYLPFRASQVAGRQILSHWTTREVQLSGFCWQWWTCLTAPSEGCPWVRGHRIWAKSVGVREGPSEGHPVMIPRFKLRIFLSSPGLAVERISVVLGNPVAVKMTFAINTE